MPIEAFLGMSEADWQGTVVQYARALGWEVYHTHDSRRSEAGYPDLTLVRPPRVVFAELKVEERKGRGRLTSAQGRWLEKLGACPGVEAYLWRPSQHNDVWDILERK